jgi:catechol 2,3-dioxygenase-like lactoylglutathione lyase family enzyme
VYRGRGVHHVAIGVKSLRETRAFYRDVLDFTEIFVDFPEAEYPALQPVVRANRVVYSAVLFNQPAGGIILELIDMADPPSRPIRKNVSYGDIGVSKISITVPDIDVTYKELKGRVKWCFEQRSVTIEGFGDYRFAFCEDPEGNLVEFVSAAKLPVRQRFGGISSVGISVTDLDRSVAFYQKYLGFDKVVIAEHDRFSGRVGEITGSQGSQIRSCLLANSHAEGMVELFEVSKPRGRSIPFAARWGDYGYLQMCLNGNQGDDINRIAAYLEQEGLEFLCEPQFMHDEKEGAFFYMKDPDGIPVEFLVFLK